MSLTSVERRRDALANYPFDLLVTVEIGATIRDCEAHLGEAGLPRTWTINGRFLTQPLTGVQRYAGEIVRALDREIKAGHPFARDLQIKLLAPRGAGRHIALEAIEKIEIGGGAGYAWEQLILPFRARGGMLSLGNVGPIMRPRHIVCLHDATPRSFPASYSRLYRVSQRLIQPVLARTATKVVTVSRFSAGELVRYGLSARQPPCVIPNGHEHALRWRPRHSSKTRGVAGLETIVMIGASAPHKNMALICGLADRLAAAGFRIAIVGAADPRVFLAGVAPDAPGLVWLGRLADGEMAALLQDSLCLAFPSLTEGFGLPPLEAMALGCPVVASDRASLPEICGEAALYASPFNPDQWLEAFVKLRDVPGLRMRMIACGRQRAKAFSWRQSAQDYLSIMAAADGVLVDTAPQSTAPDRHRTSLIAAAVAVDNV